ncbi:MAG TPA: GNAT family N-acetyltransferase [Puia sp.]|jgi:ribosomal protein S18 acetylase RimI-like enzyme|nr:GNAT family N-acetyltransferase [Puia sp.]
MHPLDNPAWSALTTEQAKFARGAEYAKRYLPEILPFVGLASGAAPEHADPYIAPGESFYIIGDLPPLPAGWKQEHELPCAQLLAPENLHCMPQPIEPILLLGEPDKADMFGLIDSLQPGYYHPDTRRTGDYCGIRRDGRLVAMAGERMRMTGFSELSAICTHPDFTGHGYAQQLIAWLCRRQVAAGITPFLHVSLANQRALRLYLYLGFRHRREITFRRMRKSHPLR